MLRGELEGVYVDVADNKTNVVLVSAPEGTLFTKTVSSDAFYPIRVPLYDTSGVALTETHYFHGDNLTNSYTVALIGKMPLADVVTIRAAGAANTTGTNSVTIKVIYNK
jgi:hypothetical protein